MTFKEVTNWLIQNPLVLPLVVLFCLAYTILFDLYIENQYLSRSVNSVRESLMVKKSRELDIIPYKRQLMLFEEGNQWFRSILALRTYNEQVEILKSLAPKSTLNHEFNHSFPPIYYKRFSIIQSANIDEINNLIKRMLIEKNSPVMVIEAKSFLMKRDEQEFKVKFTFDTVGYENAE